TVCEQALRHVTEQDRQYVFMNQQLERESALALAGLGRIEEAVVLADKLLAECASGENLLIRGLLHFDRARIARRAGDDAAFEEHANAAKADLTATHNPSGIARVNRLFDAARGAAASRGYIETEGHTSLLKQLVDPARRSKATRVLEEIATTVEAQSAQLYVVLYGKPVLCAQYGDGMFESHFEPTLAKLAAKLDGQHRDPVISDVLSQVPAEFNQTGRLVPLVAARAKGESQLIALVALGRSARPEAISELDLRALAEELSEVDDATEAGYVGEDDD
ncbi:MAG TPA: hypothetical protein VI299_05870, partial [Polyangiales bacterium]